MAVSLGMSLRWDVTPSKEEAVSGENNYHPPNCYCFSGGNFIKEFIKSLKSFIHGNTV